MTAQATLLTPQALSKLGRAMYGDQWQNAMARDLELNPRSIRYMAAGDRPVTEATIGKLVKVLVKRVDFLESNLADLQQISQDHPAE